MPRSLITGLSQLFHNQEVTLRVHRDEAQAAGKRFVLGHGAVLVGPVLGHAYGCIAALGHPRVFHLDIDLLRRPIGGRHKAVETRQVQEETHQANTTGPDFDADQMAGNHEAV